MLEDEEAESGLRLGCLDASFATGRFGWGNGEILSSDPWGQTDTARVFAYCLYLPIFSYRVQEEGGRRWETEGGRRKGGRREWETESKPLPMPMGWGH